MKKIFSCIVILIAMLIAGCKKNSAVTIDTINPDLRITISGGGFSKTFYSTEDYTSGILNLKHDTKYTYSVTINDTGGVQKLQLQLPTIFTLDTLTSVPAHTEAGDFLQKVYTILGTSSNPYTSFVMTGSFTTSSNNFGDQDGTIMMNGSDYAMNSVHIHINSYVSASPPGGYGWVIP